VSVRKVRRKRGIMNGDWNRNKEEKVRVAVNIVVADAGVVVVVVVVVAAVVVVKRK
jgi:hypothetical protein